MKRFFSILTVLFCSLFPLYTVVHAVVVEYDRISPPVVVRLYPKKSTEIVFPEIIVDVITSLTESDASLEKSRDARRFYIMTPKEDLDTEVYFLGASGRSYSLVFRTVKREADRDANVIIVDRRVTKEGVPVKEEKPFLSPALLIKAMILDQKMPGITGISDTDEVLLDLPEIGLTIKGIKKYETALMVGYVVNILYDGNDFDIRKLSHPKLVAGTIYNGKGYLVFYK